MFPITSDDYVIESKNIAAAKKLVLDEMENLRRDYHPNLDMNQFLIKYIYPDSPFLLMLQARCFFLGLATLLVDTPLLNFVAKFLPAFDLYHACFIRFHHPFMTSNGKSRLDNCVASPLHYDNYDCDTRTTWIPLQDINEGTGSLCYTNSPELIALTGAGLSPKQMHQIEQSDSNFQEIYIRLLESEVKSVECAAGQVIIFDKNLLHGSTYPASQCRISVDMRWVSSLNESSLNAYRVNKSLKKTRENALVALYKYRDEIFINRVNRRCFLFTDIKMRLRGVEVIYKAVIACKDFWRNFTR